MIKEAINRVLELATPNQITDGTDIYVDKQMFRLNKPKYAAALSTHTLSSIVDYITSNTDNQAFPEGGLSNIIHISDYDRVTLYKELDADKGREGIIACEAITSPFNFGRFMELENFIIQLQSCFVQDESTAALLSFLASVKDDTGVQQQDNGVTQTVTVKSGVSLAKTSAVPNPVILRPFRTFSEIEQPASSFVFRIRKEERTGVIAALFESDGNAWKHQAIKSIEAYFDNVVWPSDPIILA